MEMHTYFTLKSCSTLANFLELPRDLSYLNLTGTTIEVLRSSIKLLDGLCNIKLKNCKRLVSFWMVIWKLKRLQCLDLTGCSEFKNFPEIFEPMEHMGSLSLKGTTVKELPLSIGNLIRLQVLELSGCENLEYVPSSIYSLNWLECLMFDGCLKLQKFPPFSGGLLSLKELSLSYCSILEIPDFLLSLTTLQELDLSGTMIEGIRRTIKQSSELSILN
ncbi:PREDICTED: probable WRKY transcription factor 19 [Prunus mume]|uniref:Probable WRKY transcription factor 19 n=1 Tax=Prunus mume TaxID=102107 RepID=A0ABM1LI85_PRUMU|nr:PREDICTED: probable WRKY transcription factor 19 [Prunus mume]